MEDKETTFQKDKLDKFNDLKLGLREILSSTKVLQQSAENPHETLEGFEIGDNLEIIIDRIHLLINDFEKFGKEHLSL